MLAGVTAPADPTRAAAAQPVNLGAIFTRRWVADLVLDLAGYSVEEPLHERVAVEPACGPGAFVAAMAERLVASCARHGVDLAQARGAIVAVDIDPEAVRVSKDRVINTLVHAGVTADTARTLADAWIRQGDFLQIAPRLPVADWVVGNPPYVRIEDVEPQIMRSYRKTWQTMTGRADVYVGFIEAGLGLLRPGGRLSFICADRWMRNQYGARLRTLVEGSYSVDACVVLHDVDAFEDRVAAYPAITVIRNDTQGPALVADADADFDEHAAARLTGTWRAGPGSTASGERAFTMSWLPGWFTGQGSWPAATPRHLALLTELEGRWPTLAEAGVRVAVGVATGADDAYLTTNPDGIEPQRLLKIVSARELTGGTIAWCGRWLVNPWDEHGLVDLAHHPGLARYITRHEERIRDRHVAKANPARWWRTLDRVHPRVAGMRKLLVPDLKDRILPVLDEGQYYPSHSLYYLTSDEWDLQELGGLLLSDIANLFVSAYSVRMASGYMRVSAQYLRRVRIPRSADVPADLRERLAEAFRTRDRDAANRLAHKAYGIDSLDLSDTA
jgi:hypothetical protein